MTREPSSCASNGQCARRVRSRTAFVSVLALSCCSGKTSTNEVMGLAAPPFLSSMNHHHYQPPVKSSVKKLYDRRFSRDPSRIASDKGAPSSSPSSTRTTSSYASAAAYAPPLPTFEPTPSSSSSSSSRVASFERRMREALFGVPTTSTSSKVQPTQQRRTVTQQRQQQQPRINNKPANVKTVESLQDFKTIVGDETEKLVAVRFHATYCRACNAVAPHFYKLATVYPNVVFVDVPVSERNAVVHQGLGVPSLPYAHIYHPEAGLVEEHKLTRKDIAEFRHVLQTYLDGFCDNVSTEE